MQIFSDFIFSLFIESPSNNNSDIVLGLGKSFLSNNTAISSNCYAQLHPLHILMTESNDVKSPPSAYLQFNRQKTHNQQLYTQPSSQTNNTFCDSYLDSKEYSSTSLAPSGNCISPPPLALASPNNIDQLPYYLASVRLSEKETELGERAGSCATTSSGASQSRPLCILYDIICKEKEIEGMSTAGQRYVVSSEEENVEAMQIPSGNVELNFMSDSVNGAVKKQIQTNQQLLLNSDHRDIENKFDKRSISKPINIDPSKKQLVLRDKNAAVCSESSVPVTKPETLDINKGRR